jgi:uncharacterized protein YdaU (DUF1376 family)
VNYYERHLGDYARNAGHLSMLEHGAYTCILDRYYTTEAGIPAGQVFRLTRAMTAAERKAVDSVLREFFRLVDGVWVNDRCDQEIAKAQTKIKAARENGKLGGRPKATEHEPNGNPPGNPPGSESVTQTKALQTPDTRHQDKPPTPAKRGNVHEFPPGFDTLWSVYPRKTAKPKAAQAFTRLAPDAALLRVILAAVAEQSRSEQWSKDGGQFIPHLATWINGRRWEDQILAPQATGTNLFEGVM